MKCTIITLLLLLFINMPAQNIKLPQPRTTGGKPLMEALNSRVSGREYSDKALDYQTISNMLWAAWGYNRDNKRTAPSSHNRQEIDLYVFLQCGTYIYDARNNELVCINTEDWRQYTGTQQFVASAPINIAMVADTEKITGKTPQGVTEAIYANTGFISQNIYLFCASEGLCSVTRAMVPKEELSKMLNLKPSQVITLVHTAGWCK
ncbi:MAG: SagB/ThcOx family dehydrogenase [Bacteroidales bacterium]|nr:SagB/ThcOx family dehydrogenase [Bacteroidales bacterium]MDD4670975.1 SagB/ThcOx family dehydrogenase [Bacteroidales bacterium]